MQKVCEACEICPAETVDPCEDATSPYYVCSACHTRLHEYALRPLEWYNLAKRHGWFQFLLHEDFYLEDGTASEPGSFVQAPERYPAPTPRPPSRHCGFSSGRR